MRVGIVGYGHLGKYLVDFIQEEGAQHNLILDFVWNRTEAKLEKLQRDVILNNLEEVKSRKIDLIVEVAHPEIVKNYGELFLSVANLFVGSPTALASSGVETSLRKACISYNHAMYIPSGAFWGAQDIQKMACLNTLSELKVTMKKHPSSFKLSGDLKALNDSLLQEDSKEGNSVVLYNGPVRDLCPKAPNNVNTMAAAAIAAHNLGFDKVIGCLISDKTLLHWHIIEIEVTGHKSKNGESFQVKTVRKNPSNPGAVTGSATYGSFKTSLLQALKQSTAGVHMC